MIERLSEYGANVLTTVIQGRFRQVARTLATGKTSLINAGNNNVITFPVIVSSDIPDDTALDIAKDIETNLAFATKNFIEGDISRGAFDVSITAIMSSLPFNRLNAGTFDAKDPASQGLVLGATMGAASAGSPYAEAVRRAGDKLHARNLYAEANNNNVEFVRDGGTTPTILSVKIPYITGGDKNEIKDVVVQLGFEGVVRKVDSDELVTRVGNFDSNRFFKNFIKLSKGEISFMGDFLFEMDRLKLEAKSQATANKLWKTLELYNRKRDIFVKSYPFTTFVISDEVADRIKERYTIDTSSERQVKALMDSFFAFAFYEVNTGTGVIRVMKDGDAIFKTCTIDDIVRTNTKLDRQIKEVIKAGGGR